MYVFIDRRLPPTEGWDPLDRALRRISLKEPRKSSQAQLSG